MALLDIFRRKQVTDDTKYMVASVIASDATQRGKSPTFSMRASVNEFHSWTYAAATLNAQAVASIPLRLFVRTDAQESQRKLWRTREVSRSRKAFLLGDATRKPSIGVMKAAAMAGDFVEVVDAHPVLELLRKANKVEDGFGLAVTRILFLELCGNAYLHVVTDPVLGVPSELWTVPAQHVTIVASKTDLVEAYLYGVSSQSMQRFETDEIIHFKRPNPKSLYYGLGKVEAAWGAIRLNTAMHEQDLALAQNMSRPDYAAIIKGGASESALRRFEESMRALHGGAQKSGRMVAITGDVQLVPLSFPNKDLGGRDEVVEEISAVFGVPVSMLKANDPNLASATTGYASWRESCIAPICRLDEETLNARLLPLFGIEGDAYLAYDDAVPSNRQADSTERGAAVAGGWRTPNEARMEEGYEELDDPHANQLHVGGQMLGGTASPIMPMGGSPFALPKPQQVEAPAATVALNGAQISSAQSIIEGLGLGTIAPSVAVSLLSSLGIPKVDAQAMVNASIASPPPVSAAKALSDIDTTPTDEMARLAARGLELRAEFNRGGTAVGVARARDISNMVSLSPDTVGRMNSFFARHRVDLNAVGAQSGDDGYPSAGAIAWMLWGGDPNNPDGAGAGWASRKADELAAETKSEYVEDDEAKLDRVREKIALIEAKAWIQAMQPDTRIDEIEKEMELLRAKSKNAARILAAIQETIDE